MKAPDPDYELGCQMPQEQWVWLNRSAIFEDPGLRRYVAPFPPMELVRNVSHVKDEQAFASEGTDLFAAISKASPMALVEYRHILDFGCGCGRLARMLKGHPHRLSACDVDPGNIEFVKSHLGFVEASLSSVNPPLPYANDLFDAVIAISVFTHLNEYSQDAFLSELCRVSRPGANLFITVHGERAVQRSQSEPEIRGMIAVDQLRFDRALQAFAKGSHGFILQDGHLTAATRKRTLLSLAWEMFRPNPRPFEYGIAFIPEKYIRSHWNRWFEIVGYHHGTIHDWQDIVVLTPLKGPKSNPATSKNH